MENSENLIDNNHENICNHNIKIFSDLKVPLDNFIECDFKNK